MENEDYIGISVIRNIKSKGQVYTPPFIVQDVLDAAGYMGSEIICKHVMENSCGQGAFLKEIVNRYIESYLSDYDDLTILKKQLEEFIHAIDIDEENIDISKNELNSIVSDYGINNVEWHIICADSMETTVFNNSMDFVLGNPPYVRVHNLNSSYNVAKRFHFAQDGMTDLFIVFFEIGLNMLKKGGILSYITANSYYTSIAGQNLRNYLHKTRSLHKIMELGHYNPFRETTYTTITVIQKGISHDSVEYYHYDANVKKPIFQDEINYQKLFINDLIILSKDSKSRNDFAKIFNIDRKNHPDLQVKNGFATLSDRSFIYDDFPDSKNIIEVYKASTGEWKKCIYPYDKKGRPLRFDDLDDNVKSSLFENKRLLEGRNLTATSKWYEFGRTQGIKDVYKNKIAVNNLIKDKTSIKLAEIKSGQGVYSGLYILTDKTIEEVSITLRNEDFINYVKQINKCKNGGYYTFSTNDLNKYLIFKLKNIEIQSTLL